MSEPYRPSNGNEGDNFMSKWCNLCANDDWDDEAPIDEPQEMCDILGRALALDIDDTDYPQEWIKDENGIPKCTAFCTDRTKADHYRCPHTGDLFNGERQND